VSLRFLIVLLVLAGLRIQAQNAPSQRPVFANKTDSIAYAILDAKLDARMQQLAPFPSPKLFDSIQTARRLFLDAHPFVWRYVFSQGRYFTPYQSLKSIANKDSITSISILGNARRRLPDSLYLYKNLAELELIDFKLSKLPRKLLRQPQFKKIALYNNFPARRLKLPKSSSITALIIRGDEKGMLPKKYKAFRNLEVLTLSRNNMRAFPNAAGCNNLKLLLLAGNSISLDKRPRKIPISLWSIDLSLNKIVTVPSWIGEFTNARTLNFNNNKIERVEPGIEKITGLQELSLYKNNLSEIPPMLYTMTSLKVIDLYYNRIPKVSPKISNWKDLEILYLASNDIYSIPEELGQLVKLRELYLHHNKLSNLPHSIGNLEALNILRINNNNIVEWPVELNRLKSLGNFDCSFNQFDNIPVTELDFRNMKILSLGGNPWNADARKKIEVWVKALRENDVVVHMGDGKRPE
jgi:Leucine-rich repeat (LRR) protein